MKRMIAMAAALLITAVGLYFTVFSLKTKLFLIITAIGALLLFGITFFTGPDWEDRVWYSKLGRVLWIIFVCGVFSAVIGGALFLINPLGNDEGTPIANVSEHINIWGNAIPGNDLVSKLDYMEVEGEPPVPIARMRFERAIASSEYSDILNIVDTYTYTHGIQGEYDSSLFNDEPFVIPYIAEDSKDAVIIIPGGGYAIRTNEGSDAEGAEIARLLNEKGITAFVFWYRANPYPSPIAEMDLQRAVKWVRANADNYGYDKNRVSLIGFGAGGNLAAEFINKRMGESLLPEGFTGDSIDSASDTVASAAMIYPFMNYKQNVPLLFTHYNSDEVRSATARAQLMEDTDLTKQFNSAEIRQFVSYGTSDKLVGSQSAKDYIAAAQNAGCDITEKAVNAGHYYSPSYYFDDYIAWLTAEPAEEKGE